MQLNSPNYLHFKNFLPKDDFDKLASFVNSSNFSWHWRDNATRIDDKYNFHHMLYRANPENNREIKSSCCQPFEGLFASILQTFNGKMIVHAKMVLSVPRPKKEYTGVHYDLVNNDGSPVHDKANILIFNFTTCNGGTQINGIDVPSVENSAVLFSNTISHCGIIQTDTPKRILLNFVFIEN